MRSVSALPRFALLLTSAVTAAIAAHAGMIYVDDDAPLGGDGASWPTAFRYLQDALLIAQDGDEIRIAGGLYKPDRCESCAEIVPGDREASFCVRGIALSVIGAYGGLSGASPDDQNADLYPSILSGDLMDDDLPGFLNYEENSERVLLIVNGANVQGRNLVVRGGWMQDGGGVYVGNSMSEFMNCELSENRGGLSVWVDGSDAAATLTGCTLKGNHTAAVTSAENAQGQRVLTLDSCHVVGNTNSGLRIRSSAMLKNCLIENNYTYEPYSAGGVDIRGRVTIRDCTIRNNAGEGGGLRFVGGRLNVRDSSFIGNTGYTGGGLLIDGFNFPSSNFDVTIKNCLIRDNIAAGGGGLWCAVENDHHVQIADCTFANNRADGAAPADLDAFDNIGGGAIRALFGQLALSRCVFVNNQAIGALASGERPVEGGAIGAPLIGAGQVFASDCVFAGNRAERGGAPPQTTVRGSAVSVNYEGTLANCLFVGNVNEHAGGAALKNDGECTILNCLVADNANGGVLNNNAADGLSMANSIVWGNVHDGGAADQAAQISGPASVNYCAVQGLDGSLGGDGNIGTDPRFDAAIINTWAAPASYDPSAGQTTFVDNNANWVRGEFAGRFINPNRDQMLQSIIARNTATTITVWGNFADLGAAGAAYSINDYRVANDSPCIDAGDNAAAATDSFDLDQDGDTAEPAPFDLAGCPRFHDAPTVPDTGAGAGPIIDMGTYEVTGCPDDLNANHKVGASVAAPSASSGTIAHAGVIFVDDNAPLGGDGVSWTTAFRSLQDALLAADDGDEIRIAGGVYKPDTTAPYNSEVSFEVPPLALRIVGGYRGLTPGGSPNQHDAAAFESVLDGDLLGDDGPDFTHYADNSRTLIRINAVSAVAEFTNITLRGAYSGSTGGAVSLTAGAARFDQCRFLENQSLRGGAVYANAVSTSLVIERCHFERNATLLQGAAIYVLSSPDPLDAPVATVAESHFVGNRDTSPSGMGGVIWVSANTRIEQCKFLENDGGYGGAVAVDGQGSIVDCYFARNTGAVSAVKIRGHRATVQSCRFVQNTSTGYGTIMVGDVGSGQHAADILDCLFLQNSGVVCGGLYVTSRTGEQANVRNCTFVENNATATPGSNGTIGGGAVRINSARPSFTRCVFVANTATGPDAQGGAIGGFGTTASASLSAVHCLFVGNSAVHGPGDESIAARGGAIVIETPERPLIHNSIVAGNFSGDLSGRGIRGPVQIVNSAIVANHGGGASCFSTTNSIFWNNFISGAAPQAAQLSVGATRANYSAIQGLDGSLGGVGNIGDDPLFTPAIVGSWTAPAVYDPNAVQTTFTDHNANWLPGQLAGRFINPDRDQMLQSIIVNNTRTTITAWGNFAALGVDGAAYAINDYRISSDSPCIDAGDNAAVGPDDFDLDNDGDTVEPTPLDLAGCPRFDDVPAIPDTGVAAPPIVDMGPYEVAGCVGDLDGDDLVGAGDLAILLANFGAVGGVSPCEGDLDHDGAISLSDLAMQLGAYGESCG